MTNHECLKCLAKAQKTKVEHIKGEVEKILINSEMEGVWELIKKEFQEEKEVKND